MFCIDWGKDNPIDIHGYEFDDEYTRLEVILLPCNYVHTQLGYIDDPIHPECVGDLEEQISYLGRPNLLIYINQ